MDLWSSLLVGAFLAVFTAIQAWLTKERFDKQDQRIDRLEDSIDRRFDHVAAEFAGIRSELAGVRSDLTQIALALGLRARPETG